VLRKHVLILFSVEKHFSTSQHVIGVVINILNSTKISLNVSFVLFDIIYLSVGITLVDIRS